MWDRVICTCSHILFRTIIFRIPQWFRQATRKEEYEFMHSAGRKVREKLSFLQAMKRRRTKKRWILKRKVQFMEWRGGGMQLTEDNVQWPGFSISVVLIRQCYLFKSWILHLLTAEIIFGTPSVPELNSAANFCFRSYTTILTEIQLVISQIKYSDEKMRPTCQVLI
jgi:hypothetical protein